MWNSSRDWRAHAPGAALAVTIATIAVAGCGESEDHDKDATYVTGVAATGAPIARAAVTLKDHDGKSSKAETASDGSFRINTEGLAPPYLLQVAGPDGSLYSVSADALTETTINVTTLTDLTTRSWFTVNGTNSLDAVFANPSGVAYPTPSQVDDVEELMDGVFALWLQDAGINPSTHNLISTPFKADGTGIDKVLDETSVAGWVVTITGTVTPTGSTKQSPARMAASPVTRTQVTTLSFDAAEKSVTVDSSVTAGEEVTTSVATTVVATSSAMETAFEQIDAGIKAVANVANQKGQALAVEDVLPYIDPAAMNQGLNQVEQAELFVAQAKMSSGALGGYLISLDQLDTVNGTAHGYYTFTETANGQTATNRQESAFRLVNGKWLASGDGRPGYMYVKAQTFTDAFNSRIDIEANASTREGAYVAAAITGGNWANLAMPQDDSTTVDEAGHRFRGFWYGEENLDTADLPAAGTPFTFKLTPASGAPQEYTVKMNCATTARVWITSAPSGSAPDLVGKTVSLSWTLPTTIVIDEVNLQGAVSAGPANARVDCDIWGAPLSTTATMGTIEVPFRCDGQDVDSLYITVNVEGVNGEEISAYRFY